MKNLRNKIKNMRGITLIALIITIIVLLILAGVVINMTVGNDGIIGKAQSAVDMYKNAQEQEEALLKETGNYITDGYLIAARGEEKTEMKKFGNTDIPIPGGFYYVGGNLDTGIVISDNKADAGKGDSFAVAQTLQGNQFVWIPCKVTDGDDNEYKKETTDWNSYKSPSGFTPTDVERGITDKVGNEKTAVKKYGGFYVARYEAGLANSIDRTTSTQNWNSGVYNYYGTPISKAKQIPWNFVDYNHAWVSSLSMYQTKTVSSSLITGTQWDVMLKVMEGKGKVSGTENSPSLTDSGAWGNYKNQKTTYTGRASLYDGSNLSAFPETETTNDKEKDTMYVLTTGSSEKTKVYNIFDVAGNLWEWTVEANGGNRVVRGGSCDIDSGTYPACCRNGIPAPTSTGFNVGFRVVLYVE